LLDNYRKKRCIKIPLSTQGCW